MANKNITETMTEMVNLLSPLKSDDRQRVIQAAMTLLGESPIAPAGKTASREEEAHVLTGDLPSRAKVWTRQNGISVDAIDQVYQVDGESVEVIAGSVPGNSKKEQTLNAYVLAGISRLLASGEPSFDDKLARSLCDTFGCYDPTNHATHMKGKGNRFAGSKTTGWKLTGPGLTHAAALIKQMTKSAQ